MPLDLKPVKMLPPSMLTIMPSTSSDSAVLFNNTVSFKPAAGSPVNAPHIGSQMLSRSLVTTSLVLMPSAVKRQKRRRLGGLAVLAAQLHLEVQIGDNLRRVKLQAPGRQ